MYEKSFISFYEFGHVSHPERTKTLLLEICEEKEILGTVTLSLEGINGSLVGIDKSITSLLKLLVETLGFKRLLINQSIINSAPFDRLVIRIKDEIVTSGFQNHGFRNSNYVDPKDWDDFTKKDNVLTIDVRNFYEHQIGTFSNAIHPNIRRFREFPKFIERKLKKERDKKIAIFCTGGIRCEKASHMLKNSGFPNVHQLKGGIFNYFKSNYQSNSSLWQGDCFVFDKRLAIDRNFDTSNYEQCPGCKEMIPKKNQPVDDIEWAPCPQCCDGRNVSVLK